jgi:predicted ATPase
MNALILQYFQPHDATLALKTLICVRTGGNPFFVEELPRALYPTFRISLCE